MMPIRPLRCGLSIAGFVFVLVTGARASDAQAARTDQPLPIVPAPVRAVRQPGHFGLSGGTVIRVDRTTQELGHVLAGTLAPATGLRLAVSPGQSAQVSRASSAIVLRTDATLLPKLGPEGYRLEVTPRRVTIAGGAEAGVFYGIQTLRQLLPVEIFRKSRVPHVEWNVPCVTVEDYPRFVWRGAMIDVSRHFMPREFVEKFIDLLALHKMNTFHWHLTDDQGWRLEVRKYPRLTDIGAWRKETVIGRPGRDEAQVAYDGERHGGYYTQADVREVVEYARERFVTIVPEIEMPGHSQAAIAAYPKLGNTDDAPDVSRTWGVHKNILNPEDATIHFMQDVLTEVMEIFPGRFIHIGGDEADKTQWRASERVQARIKALGLQDEREMQSWFIRQMDAFLAAHGRRLIGWDEILEGGLAPGAAVMSWHGVAGGVTAARAGHDVVMAPTTHTYFDYYQSQDRQSEPLAIGGFLPLEKVYAFEPIPAELDAQLAKHVLGAQGQMWTEYMKGPKQLEYMTFPRAAALAEVVWTPPERKDFADFTKRLDIHAQRLKMLDVAHHPVQTSGDEWTPLFNGKDLSGWHLLKKDGSNGWVVADGVYLNTPPSTDIQTDAEYNDFDLHVEFKVIAGATGNSGVYLRDKYEIQIFDSFGKPPTDSGCGALYRRIAPAVNASRPAGEWQTFDISFIGRRLTVIHNGQKVLDAVDVGPMGTGAASKRADGPGPLRLQGDHDAVAFRNVRIRRR
jgi:hexosaminidase